MVKHSPTTRNLKTGTVCKDVDGKTPRRSAQRPFQGRNRSNLKENRLGQTKRRVGRPRKHAVPEATSSEDTVGPVGVVEQPAAQGQTSFTNSSQANTQGHVAGTDFDHPTRNGDGEASQMTSSGPRMGCAASQANMCSPDLPVKTENVDAFPLKTEIMAVIYPCEALSVHLPKEAMAPQTRQQKASQEAKEPCFHEALKEHHCNGISGSSTDYSISEKGHGVLSSPSVSQSDLPKRRPGQPKKKRGRPKKAHTTVRDLSPSTKPTPLDGNHNQVVLEQVVNHQTPRQQASKESRAQTLDSKVCNPLVLLKDCCKEEGSEKSQGAPPLATKLSAQPTTAGAEQFRCDHCNFESSIREKLDNHVRYQHGYIGRNGKHKCEKCNYSTNFSAELKSHNIKHTGERPCPCSVCGKGFARKSSLNVHMLIHTAKKTFKCETCGNAYRTASKLKNHQRVHTEEKHYRCGYCVMAFRYQYKLDIHARKHTGEKPYRCVHCGNCLRTKTSLVNHIRTHTGEKPHRCNICGKAFAFRGNLIDHTARHLKERSFKCNYCKKSFKAKKFLVTHMKVHTGDKRFACQICGKAFIRPSALDFHVRTHTGERPFSCEVCGKSFIEKRVLKYHFVVHTGEKPFKCETCGLMFRYKGNLNSHVKRFHKDVNCKSIPMLS